MAQYVEIKNDEGRILINDSYTNFSFVSKTTLAVSGNSISIPFNYSTELIAVKAPIGIPIRGNMIYKGPNSASLEIEGFSKLGNLTSITVYRFTKQTASGNFGLEIYNESGQQVFTSNLTYMRVLGFYHSSVTSSQAFTGYLATMPAFGYPVSTIAVVPFQTPLSARHISGNGDPEDPYMYCNGFGLIKWAADNSVVGTEYNPTNNPTEYVPTIPNCVCLAIDVSNL